MTEGSNTAMNRFIRRKAGRQIIIAPATPARPTRKTYEDLLLEQPDLADPPHRGERPAPAAGD